MKRNYINLRAEMARNGVSVDDVAKILRVHRNTAGNKVNGDTPFTIPRRYLAVEACSDG